VRRLKPR